MADTPKSTAVKAEVDSKESVKESKKELVNSPKVVTESKPEKIVTKVKLPGVDDFLKNGVQFGHEKKRWSPKFANYIFGAKKNIHIINLSKTLPLLEAAGDFIAQKAQEGPILFLGTKRQAAEIVANTAQEIGVHYVTNRWAGGFLTNFSQMSASLKKLNEMERMFEEGVTGRTKFEVSVMKRDWDRLNRLYGGVKQLTVKPAAVFVIDPGFERGAVRECNNLDIPVVAMVDSNSDPTIIDYPIPANDDAIGSIKLVVGYIADRIKETNAKFKVTHFNKDYSKVKVEIRKAMVVEEAAELVVESKDAAVIANKPNLKQVVRPVKKSLITKPSEKSATPADKQAASGGILSRYQEQKEKSVPKRA